MKCPHNNYCNLKKIDSQRCADYENCESYKYLSLMNEIPIGIGALMSEDISRLEKEVEDSQKSKEINSNL